MAGARSPDIAKFWTGGSRRYHHREWLAGHAADPPDYQLARTRAEGARGPDHPLARDVGPAPTDHGHLPHLLPVHFHPAPGDLRGQQEIAVDGNPVRCHRADVCHFGPLAVRTDARGAGGHRTHITHRDVRFTCGHLWRTCDGAYRWLAAESRL